MVFAEDRASAPKTAKTDKGDAWKVMVVDDDEVMHDVTALVLQGQVFKDKPIQLLQAYSAADAYQLLDQHPDVAVILLDVVMEKQNSGFEVVKYVRETLGNRMVRIVLRTGQPGLVPADEAIQTYDINDYKEKADLTADRLKITLIGSLRNYADLLTIRDLARNNINLESLVQQRTKELEQSNQQLKEQLAEGILLNRALKKSTARLLDAQRIANLGHWEMIIDDEGDFFSDSLKEMLGLHHEKKIDYSGFLARIPKIERIEVEKEINRVLTLGGSYQLNHTINTPHKGLLKITHRGEAIIDGEHQINGIKGTVQDVTESHRIKESMYKYGQAIEQAADSIMITNNEGIIEFVNQAFEDMTGYSRDEVHGMRPNILKSGQQKESFYRRMWGILTRGEVFSDVIANRRKDGSIYFEEKTISPLKDEHGEITHYIATGRDITERIEAQEHLYHMAHHDPLTGLPNRTLLYDRINQVLTRTPWHRRKLAVLIIDLDRFKIINDTLGHDVGDVLLQRISQILMETIREGDTVARLGGDEFAILLNDLASKSDIEPIVEKIMQSMHEVFVINEHELFVTASIGISIHPEHGNSVEALMKKADVAMYRAKDLGKNAYKFYTSEDDIQAMERLSLETGLRRALSRHEFFLNYQPQVELETGNIVGLEALLRWRHDDFKSVSPMHFIPLLEETGMIVEVGTWVIQQVCQQIHCWREQQVPLVRVAINISSRQFREPDFLQTTRSLLQKYDVPSDLIEFEITEGLLVEDIPGTRDLLLKLHEFGISLSVDDFGTGYSSLNYLKRLPMDVLKIDQSFIKDINTDPDDTAITSAIITLAHSMGLKVVAEGVETQEQVSFLREKGCDQVQGYLYSRPVDAELIKPILVRGKMQCGP